MKKWLLFTLLIATINSFSQSAPILSSPNDDSGNTLNVILSITHNDKNVSEPVRTLLNSMGGATVLAYCDNHAVFMIVIDKSFYRDAKDFMKELQKQYPKSQDLLSFKDGDFKQFIQYCQPSNVNDAANLKNLVTN